jgi:hypothetical protein
MGVQELMKNYGVFETKVYCGGRSRRLCSHGSVLTFGMRYLCSDVWYEISLF